MMFRKIIALIELWVGLGFFIGLLGYIPVINAVGGVLSSIVGFISQIPFYSVIMAILGSILFFDGLVRLFLH